jgi:hypothetical protein
MKQTQPTAPEEAVKDWDSLKWLLCPSQGRATCNNAFLTLVPDTIVNFKGWAREVDLKGNSLTTLTPRIGVFLCVAKKSFNDVFLSKLR